VLFLLGCIHRESRFTMHDTLDDAEKYAIKLLFGMAKKFVNKLGKEELLDTIEYMISLSESMGDGHITTTNKNAMRSSAIKTLDMYFGLPNDEL